MPPLLSSRTCWRAGWAVVGLGIVLLAVSTPIATALFDGQGPDALVQSLYGVLTVVVHLAVPGGVVLLVGSVVVRHVERLSDALVASGTIQPPPAGRARTRHDAVDLDDADGADVVEHEPGVR